MVVAREQARVHNPEVKCSGKSSWGTGNDVIQHCGRRSLGLGRGTVDR